MNYGTIKPTDIANGEGVRVSLFVSGCTHHCPGCFNYVTWDFNYGKPFTKETEDEILNLLSRNYIDGLSLLGGEPMEPCNQRCLVNLVDRFKEKYPNKTLWVYTGYTYDEDLIPGGKAYCEVTDKILDQCDVIVDGEFVESLKDISLKFRGSSNQRILNIRETRKRNAIVFW